MSIDVYCMFSFRIKGLTKEQAAWIQNAVVSLEMARDGIEEMDPSREGPQPLSDVDLGEIVPFPPEDLDLIFPVGPDEDHLADVWYGVNVRLEEEHGAYSAIFSDEECTATEGPHLIRLLAAFVKRIYHQPIVFEWAIANMGGLEGGFGGGACSISPTGFVTTIDTDEWMGRQMKKWEVPA